METRNCQNCKTDFVIDDEDFSFYEKLKVPAPTFCPECRMVRRMLFRNERSLYKAMCGLCGKSMLSMYSPDKKYVAYCTDCYMSDSWDPLSYAREYDISQNFFQQFDTFLHLVPRRNLYQDFAENSEYTNFSVSMKNSYLTFGGRNYEDCSYCAHDFEMKNCNDTDFSSKCEYCFESIHIKRCNQVFFSSYSEDCSESWFLYGCRNCTDCIGCTNVRNKSHCIFNEQYDKESYKIKKEELQLSTREGIESLKNTFGKHTLNFPRKFTYSRSIVNSTGDDLEQVKNCIKCFSATGDENCRYSFFMPVGAKDCYDIDHVAVGTSESYELHSAFGASRVLFSNRVYYSHDVYYSDDCYNCEFLFGCISLRKKSYCIFNKQYTKEEYEKDIEQMKNIVHNEPDGKKYSFGEFFPVSIIPFAYNETVAQEYFPIDKNTAISFGYSWKEEDHRLYKVTVPPEKLPKIEDASPDICKEVIGCADKGECNHRCTTAFKLIPSELSFYKKYNLPLPAKCPNCRHGERMSKINTMRLVTRKCQCFGTQSENGAYQNLGEHEHGQDTCHNEFETTYSSDKPEIVYCESCYQKEVA